MTELVISGEILPKTGTRATNFLQGNVKVGSAVHGAISSCHKKSVRDYLQGSVTAGSAVHGEMLTKAGMPDGDYLQGEIHASIEPVENLPQNYEGSYEIDPAKSSQVLPTKDKLMREDMTVLGIYYYEVTNEQGGKTVTIGRD